MSTGRFETSETHAARPPADPRLAWVTRNRQLRRDGHWIGPLSSQLARDDLSDRQRFHFVFETLQSSVDEAFFRLCSVDSVSHGRLVLLVNDADVRYHMEKRWRSVLAEVLAQASGSTHPWQVLFRVAHDR